MDFSVQTASCWILWWCFAAARSQLHARTGRKRICDLSGRHSYGEPSKDWNVPFSILLVCRYWFHWFLLHGSWSSVIVPNQCRIVYVDPRLSTHTTSGYCCLAQVSSPLSWNNHHHDLHDLHDHYDRRDCHQQHRSLPLEILCSNYVTFRVAIAMAQALSSSLAWWGIASSGGIGQLEASLLVTFGYSSRAWSCLSSACSCCSPQIWAKAVWFGDLCGFLCICWYILVQRPRLNLSMTDQHTEPKISSLIIPGSERIQKHKMIMNDVYMLYRSI